LVGSSILTLSRYASRLPESFDAAIRSGLLILFKVERNSLLGSLSGSSAQRASAASARLVAGQNVPVVLGGTNPALPRLRLRNYKALTNP
jgi:hypothetical protein